VRGKGNTERVMTAGDLFLWAYYVRLARVARLRMRTAHLSGACTALLADVNRGNGCGRA